MADNTQDLAKLLGATGRPRKGRFGWWLLVLLGLGGGGAYYYWTMQGDGSADLVYSTEQVERGGLTVTVTATGTVQPTNQVEVSSELSGTLSSVEVDFNETVTAGQVLARLDATKLAAQVANARAQLTAAKARVLQAEATEREAKATLDTKRELADRGIATKSDMAGFEAAYERAQASVAIAEADLTLAEANLALVEADLEKAEIRSPIDGIVLDRAAEAGQTVASSLSAPILFTLAGDLAQMELLVDIDEADIGRVKVGDNATFTVDAYNTTDFPATITQIRFAPENTNDVVTYKAVLAVDNPDKLLRPGMTATATVTVAEVQDALIVANAALRYAPPRASTGRSGAGLASLILPQRGGGGLAGLATGKSIWVLRAGVPVEVAVTLGQSDGKRTVVTSDNLSASDLAITDQAAGSQ
jgi:HlyD family secretion protein